MTPKEVLALMGACGRRSPTGIRNRALIALLWRTGLRISEALALQPKDMDPDGGRVRVTHGKGGRARTVGMDAEAFAVLERWMDRRRALDVPRGSPTFCTLTGRRLEPSYVRGMLRRLAARAGLEKRVHPHGLRHTHASELAEEGVPMPTIQAQLGHAKLETTARYLRRVGSVEHVLAAVRGRRAWRTAANAPASCNSSCE